MSKLTANAFTRIAWECDLRNAPGDIALRHAFQDWLEEHGYTNLGARRHVTKIVREGNEEAQRVRVERLMREDGEHASLLRDRIRCQLRVHMANICLFQIVTGGVAPQIVSDTSHYADSLTGELYNQERLLTDADGVLWVPGIVTIELGAAWVCQSAKPTASKVDNRRVVG